jgi:hypothetical protein
MTAITFDTLKFVERLTQAGVPEAHAKAEAQALAEALSSGGQDLVTKADLKLAVAELRADMIKAMLVQTFTLAGLAVAIVKLL